MPDFLFLGLFASIGLLYALSGVALLVRYWSRIPWSIPIAFLSFGTGILITVNRWWLFAGLNVDTVLMAAGALFLVFGWVTAIMAVLTYVKQQQQLLELHDDDDDE